MQSDSIGSGNSASPKDRIANEPGSPKIEEVVPTWKKVAVVALVAMIIAAPALAVCAIPLLPRSPFAAPNALAERITFASVPQPILEVTQNSPLPKSLFAETVEFIESPDCEGIGPFDVSASPQEITGGRFSDCRSFTRRVTDGIVSVGRSFADTANRVPSIVKGLWGVSTTKYVDPLKDPPKWKEESEGLYVMVHGLKGHPSAWDAYGDTLNTEHAQADQAIVMVPKGGNCGVKEASDPILHLVEDYIQKNPGKPVTLIGTSNGGRIVAYIETKLRTSSPKTPVLVSTIAGAHYGSRVMNTVHEYGISKILGYTPEIMEELKFGSEVVQQTLNEQRKPLPDSVERDFSFFMTTEETHIHPSTSELPIIDKGERHFVVHGEGHTSIVGRVMPDLLNHATEWMKARKDVKPN